MQSPPVIELRVVFPLQKRQASRTLILQLNMEHIPNVNGRRLDLKIPYYAVGHRYHGNQNFDHGEHPQYAGRSWDTFPERAGFPWLSEHITVQEMNYRYQRCSKNEFQAFAQTWMFFGLLNEYLGHIDYHEADFITPADEHGARYISTQITREWKVRNNDTRFKIQRRGQPDINVDIRRTNALLRKALARSTLWDRFAIDKDQSWIDLSLSFKILLEILSILSNHITHTQGRPLDLDIKAHGGPALDRIRSLLLRKAWCIHQVDYLCSMLSYTALIYLTGFSRVNRDGVDHKDCAKHRVCKAYDVDIGVNMEPVHLTQGCNCLPVEAPPGERVQILAQGGIPVLSCREHANGQLELHYTPASPDLNYAAISHLWADGLGNVFENSLPRCQLSRLLRAVQAAGKSYDIQIPSQTIETLLWVDVYCVPAQVPQVAAVHRSDVRRRQNEAQKLLKMKAIARMDATYSWANCVIALDHELARTVSSDRHPVKRKWYRQKGGPDRASLQTIAAMAISPWNTRCWTYQEHALAARTILQGIDCQTDFDEPLANSATETNLHQQFFGLTGRRSVLAGGVKLRIGSLTGWRRDRRPQTVSVLSKFGYAWNAFHGRSTTQWSDMIVVLANMLDLNARQVLQLDHGARMKAVIGSQKTLPLSILFIEIDRLGQCDPDGLNDDSNEEAPSLEDRWIPTRPQSVRLTWPRVGDLIEVGPSGLMLDSAKLWKNGVYVLQLLLNDGKLATRFRYPAGPEGTEYWINADSYQLNRCLEQRSQSASSWAEVILILEPCEPLYHVDTSTVSPGACLLSIKGTYRGVKSAAYVCPLTWGRVDLPTQKAVLPQPEPTITSVSILITSNISSWPKLGASRSVILRSLTSLRVFYTFVLSVVWIVGFLVNNSRSSNLNDCINDNDTNCGDIARSNLAFAIGFPILACTVYFMSYVYQYALALKLMYSIHSDVDAGQSWWRQLQRTFKLLPLREVPWTQRLKYLILRVVVLTFSTTADAMEDVGRCLFKHRETTGSETAELQEFLPPYNQSAHDNVREASVLESAEGVVV